MPAQVSTKRLHLMSAIAYSNKKPADDRGKQAESVYIEGGGLAAKILRQRASQ